MIAYLRGSLLQLEENLAVLDVNGVGYEVLLPTIEAKALRTRLHKESGSVDPVGDEVALWTYYHVAERQPRPLLIGFQDPQNRRFFELLLSVSEVGPTIAARSMTIPVCDYAAAIERRDVRTLGTLPGIGKRKAEQLVATLKGRAMPFALLPAPDIEEVPEAAASTEDFIADTEAALALLGHRPAEITRMIEAARRRAPDLADFQSLLAEVLRGGLPA